MHLIIKKRILIMQTWLYIIGRKTASVHQAQLSIVQAVAMNLTKDISNGDPKNGDLCDVIHVYAQ